MTTDEFYLKIQELSGLSDLVLQYLDAQLYRTEFDTEDQIDPQELMFKCYIIILGELKEMGVDVIVDWEDALANIYEADGYIALYRLLNKDYLIDQFKLYPSIQDPIRTIFIIDDSENTEEIDEAGYLQDFLDIYYKFNKTDPLISKIERIQDRVVSNPFFKKYIEVILDKSIPISTINLDNLELVSKYINKIVTGQQIFSRVVTYLIDKCGCDKDYLLQAISLYDMEKVTGLDIGKFAWAVMTDESTMSDQEKELKKKILFEHESHQTHHAEYYINNRIRPNENNLIELVAHHAEPESTKESFLKDVEEMINKLGLYDPDTRPDGLLSGDMYSLLKHIVNLILEEFYKNPEELSYNRG